MKKGGKLEGAALSLSKGWKVEKLGDVCEVFADGDWIESKDQSPEGVRLIQTGNVGNGIFKDRGEKARYISEATFKRLRCTEIFEGDCLVSRLPDPVGRACILPDTGEKMITAVDCTIIRFDKKKVIPEFFNYYSQSDQYINDVDHETSGTTRKRISRSKLAEIEIPIPPLPEQQRIVSVLDEAFLSIAQAKSNAERNLVNARELFSSVLDEIFSNLQDGWEEKTIEEVCAEIFAGGDAPKDNYSENRTEKYKVPIFANAVKDNGLYGFTDIARVTEPSITISARGSGTGHTEIRNESYLPIVRLIVLIPKLSLVTLEFLKHSIGNLEILRSGSAIPQLTVPMIKEYKIPVPPLAEQRAIVGRLEALSAETGRLEEIYEAKVEGLEELKKSVLGKAFGGEL